MLGKLLFFILLGLILFVLWQKKRIAQIKNEEKRNLKKWFSVRSAVCIL